MDPVKRWAKILAPAIALAAAVPFAFGWPRWVGVIAFFAVAAIAVARENGPAEEPAPRVRRTQNVPESFGGLPGRGPGPETPQPARGDEEGMPLSEFVVSLAVLALVLAIGIVVGGLGSVVIQVIGALVGLVAAFFGARIAIDWSRGGRAARTGSIDEAVWDASDHELDRIRRGPY